MGYIWSITRWLHQLTFFFLVEQKHTIITNGLRPRIQQTIARTNNNPASLKATSTDLQAAKTCNWHKRSISQTRLSYRSTLPRKNQTEPPDPPSYPRTSRIRRAAAITKKNHPTYHNKETQQNWYTNTKEKQRAYIQQQKHYKQQSKIQTIYTTKPRRGSTKLSPHSSWKSASFWVSMVSVILRSFKSESIIQKTFISIYQSLQGIWKVPPPISWKSIMNSKSSQEVSYSISRSRYPCESRSLKKIPSTYLKI